MKLKLNNVKAVTRVLGVCSALAVTGLAGAGFAYCKLDSNIKLAEHDAEVNTKMVEAAQCNNMLRLLASGQVEQVKQYLVTEMDYDLKTVKSMAPESGDATKEFAGVILTQLSHEQRTYAQSHVATDKQMTTDSTTLAAQKAN